MSFSTLKEEEQQTLGSILEDLRYILSLPEILPDQVDEVVDVTLEELANGSLKLARKPLSSVGHVDG